MIEIDANDTPRSLRELEAALAFVEAEMIINPGRMGPKNTGPALIHYVTIRDTLKTAIALARGPL